MVMAPGAAYIYIENCVPGAPVVGFSFLIVRRSGVVIVCAARAPQSNKEQIEGQRAFIFLHTM